MRRLTVWRREEGADDYHEAVECAVRSDGSSPAQRFVEALTNGTWTDDPEFKPPRDTEQIADWAQLFTAIRYVAQFGEPRRVGDVNSLDDGIWEFKRHNKRLTYWDTPGDGTYHPKDRIRWRNRAINPGSDFWWYPDMDGILRLGCSWPKTGQKAPSAKIQEAIAIREEDARHDRRDAAPES